MLNFIYYYISILYFFLTFGARLKSYSNAFRDAQRFKSKHPFHMVKSSPWPFVTAQTLFIFVLPLVNFLHYTIYSSLAVFVSFAIFLLPVSYWSRNIIRESTFMGVYTLAVQKNLRTEMAGFFCCLGNMILSNYAKKKRRLKFLESKNVFCFVISSDLKSWVDFCGYYCIELFNNLSTLPINNKFDDLQLSIFYFFYSNANLIIGVLLGTLIIVSLFALSAFLLRRRPFDGKIIYEDEEEEEENSISKKIEDSIPKDTSVPARGENPEWDKFLDKVLKALGLTLAQVSAKFLYELWLAYLKLVAAGLPLTFGELLKMWGELFGFSLYNIPLAILLFLISWWLVRRGTDNEYEMWELLRKLEESEKRNDQLMAEINKLSEETQLPSENKLWTWIKSFFKKKNA